MNTLLADTQSAVLVSIVKPIIMLLVLGAWAWLMGNLDKDLHHNYLKRRLWNMIHLAAGAVAFGLWLAIPIFWVGLPAALLVLVGAFAGYVVYRNAHVPEAAKWHFSWQTVRQIIDARGHEVAQRKAPITFLTADNVRMDVPSGKDALVPVHEAFVNAMQFALPRGAERIDVAVAANQAAVVVWVDGVKYPQQGIEPKLAVGLIDYLKNHAGLDVQERRKKQQGAVRVDAGDHGTHTLGLTTMGSSRDMRMVVGIDPDKRFSANYDQLGLLDQQKQQLTAALKQKGRAVLAAAPSHQGLTTTLYSLMQRHDAYTQSVMSLEDEIAFPIDGATQEVVEANADAKWINDQLARMFRQDPAVLMFSKLTDASTAKVLASAAEEVRIYAGITQGDTFAALRAWIKAIGDPKAAARSLQAVVAQRLVRKLCISCRAPFTPDPAALKKLNLPPDRVSQLYRETGQVMVKDKPQQCPACQGMGFRGRIAVFETMVLDDEARKLIAAAQLDPLRAHLRKQKMLWLQEAALARVVEGVTSISEVQRALGSSKESQ